MSKPQRVSWISLAVNLAVGFYYFSVIFKMTENGEIYGPAVTDLTIRAAMAALTIQVIIIAIVLGIVGEIVLHILSGRPADKVALDERDKRINAKAVRNGYYVLTAGLIVLMSHIVVVGGLDRFSADYPIAKPTMDFIGTLSHPLVPIVIAQFLLLASMAGSTVIYASRIFYYRRGY